MDLRNHEQGALRERGLQSGIYRQAQEEKISKMADINIIPNPANDLIEIEIKGKADGLCHIEILNMLGKKAIAEQMVCEEQHKQIDVSMLAAGVYTVKVYNNSMAKTAKLIISR